MVESAAAVIGRERELAAVEGFVAAAGGRPASLVLEGVAGIGKTSIWAEGVSAAARLGVVVRTSRCTAADAAWAFSGLGDLLEAVPEDLLAQLPQVQRQALSAALLLASPTVVAPGDRVVGVAVLGVLRLMARSAPLILAIDDIQWLDNTSRTVLTFALRRMKEEQVRVLASRRLTDDSESVADELCLGLPGSRLAVGPVSVGSLQRILRARLSLTVSRPTLTRLHQATGGNPMISLEMGRALQRLGHEPAAHDPLPVPSDVRLLVADRLRGLSEPARDLLLVCSALAHPSLDVVAAAMDDPASAAQSLAEAVHTGVLELDGQRLRFTHPLLASVPYADLLPDERRALHLRLSQVAGDPEEHARHIALGSTGPDAEVADALDLAARHARGRGSPAAAAELAELAISRTPADRPADLHRRRVTAAQYLFHLGDPDQARSMLTASLAASPSGPGRVTGLLLLATIDYWTEGSPAAARWCKQAMLEAGADQMLVARCHGALADLAPYDAVELLTHARTAVELMDQGQDVPADVLANALKNAAYHELRLGQGLSLPLLERAAALEEGGEPVPVMDRVGMYLGMMLRFSGRFADARHWLSQMRDCARDEGDDSALPNILGHLALLECWAGDYPRALAYAAEGNECSELTGVGSPSVSAALALAEAHVGHIDLARRIAVDALAYDESHGEAGDAACELRSLGFVELSVGDFSNAAEHFLRALSIAEELGVQEPAILRIHADAVEALVGLGRLAEAERLTAELERAHGREIIWSQAVAGRCRGLLLAAAGDLVAAVVTLTTALRDHEELAMPFEEARTRLWLGSVLRRAGRRGEARTALEVALEVFERLGTPLYADRARAELGRLGGRVADHFTLTETESRVAELVAAGRTNQEVAETMFIGVRTVESHLGRIYRKLGLRSRTELARSLSTPRPVDRI
jgi:DNA-binding CsgD family transcriptional regulator/Flp pilus assembly protein TadD